ncbi:hypothetical protein [Tautonia plasticadhaerens]|uniref:Uncharacterized protein n=1 Tax=Tautonia plasticadhaerens TaxID=2527974 RepID=A0A518H5V0_9BACT|nr:hypothetical protein [Tautonia plasticadhaerens]QDV36207.1 hypothetical protein ElP_41250 [Tautonia plasticadhaerens]
MALESAFQDLCERTRRCLDAAQALRLTVVEDRPLRDGALLADWLGDAAEGLVGDLEQAHGAAVEAYRAAALARDLALARRALATCHERTIAASLGYSAELGSYDRLSELIRLGRRRKGEWRAWSGSVREALDACPPPLGDLNQALCSCWQELAERATPPPITVHAIGISSGPPRIDDEPILGRRTP